MGVHPGSLWPSLQLFGTLWHSHPIPGTFRHILALSGSPAVDSLWQQAFSGSWLSLAAGSPLAVGSLWQLFEKPQEKVNKKPEENPFRVHF